MSSSNRLVRLRQGYGGTAFAGFSRFRLVNPPLTADGLPGRKKIRQANLPDFRRLPVKELAMMMGFQDEFYFSHWFKQRNGVSPSLYRDRFR